MLELLQEAGHTDFRDARGPMGFNQRQAGGRFTRDEADALIVQLEEQADAAAEGLEPSTTSGPPEPIGTSRALRRFSDQELASELQRRGWIVVEP